MAKKYLQHTAQQIDEAVEQVSALSLKVGDLNELQTEDKSNLVGAINEVAQKGGGGASTAKFVAYDNTTSELNSSNVQDAVDEVVRTTPNMLECDDADIDISDKEGYVLARFANGHIQTKNFDSSSFETQVQAYPRKVYKRQIDNEFIFNNVGLIGTWVKRTMNVDGDNVDVATSISAGSELLFMVRNTTSVTINFISEEGEITTDGNSLGTHVNYNVDDGSFTKIIPISAQGDKIEITGLSLEEHVIRVTVGHMPLNFDPFHTYKGLVNFKNIILDENGFAYPLDTKNKKILCCGDSIVEGDGFEGFAYTLAKMLNAQNVHCAMSASGIGLPNRVTVPKLAQLLEECIEGHIASVNPPDLVMISVGTNDGNSNQTTFVNEYKNFVKLLRNRFGGIPIFACAAFNRMHLNDVKKFVAENNDGNIFFVDTTNIPPFTTKDGTHPSGSGITVCAKWIYDAICNRISTNYFNSI